MKFVQEIQEKPSEETVKRKRRLYAVIAIILSLLVGVSVFITVVFINIKINSDQKNASYNTSVDKYDIPTIYFDAYSNCTKGKHNLFKNIYNGYDEHGNIGIYSAYWNDNFTIDLEVSSNSSNESSIKSSDIVLGSRLSLVSVNFVKNYTKNGLRVSKYRITLKSKIAVSMNGTLTNIKIKENTFINQKGYSSHEFEIPIFLSPYE